MRAQTTYTELLPSTDLAELIDSFWKHENLSEHQEETIIFPDSFAKLIIVVINGKIQRYFFTGVWTEQKAFMVPPRSMVFGCRLKVLAPEFLFNQSFSQIKDAIKPVELGFLKVQRLDLSNFETLVNQWQHELRLQRINKEIGSNKLRLSQLLYTAKGALSATEVSEQIYWSNRQINRYLNKWLGLSLKKYLNIQKCYQSYMHIRNGELQPKEDYFDQAHFIKEVKKHTGETPTELFKEQNDRFIQLKNIKEK